MHYLFLLFCSLNYLQASSISEIPILYSGRITPLYTYAQAIQDLNPKIITDKSKFLIDLEIFGPDAWRGIHLFKIDDLELKQILNLEEGRTHFSYLEIIQKLLEKNTLDLLISGFTLGIAGEHKLDRIMKGLVVNLEENHWEILSAPENFPWKNQKRGPISPLRIKESSLENLLKLFSKVSLLSYPAHSDSSLQDRIKKAGLLQLLPYREKWVSLKALDLSVLNPDTKKLERITNFTEYSDEHFYQILHSYDTYKKENSDKNLSQLASTLLTAYASIQNTPFIKTSAHKINYPSIIQLKAEIFYLNYPLLELTLLFYLLTFIAFILQSRFKTVLLIATIILHSSLLFLRIYILSRPPVSNMFETVLYVPWVAMIASGVFARMLKNRLVILCAIAGNIILLSILYMTGLNNSLENVQAVLNSQFWLMVHVLMVVGSYGFFLLSSVIAHLYLMQPSRFSNLSKPILHSLYSGTALLICGTILGGIWAAQSWGRFWDWDPKESWAFISSCIYLAFIHAYRFHYIGNFGLAIGSVLGFLAISFTWYGVNYLLGTGLHSYGFGSGGEFYYFIYVGLELTFLSAIAFKRIGNQFFGSFRNREL